MHFQLWSSSLSVPVPPIQGGVGMVLISRVAGDVSNGKPANGCFFDYQIRLLRTVGHKLRGMKNIVRGVNRRQCHTPQHRIDVLGGEKGPTVAQNELLSCSGREQVCAVLPDLVTNNELACTPFGVCSRGFLSLCM